MVTGDSQEEVLIFRYTQTDRHFIIIYISSSSSSSPSSSSYSPSYTSHIVAMLVLLLRTCILNPQALRISFAAKVIGRKARRRSDLDNEAIIVALNLARRGLI